MMKILKQLIKYLVVFFVGVVVSYVYVMRVTAAGSPKYVGLARPKLTQQEQEKIVDIIEARVDLGIELGDMVFSDGKIIRRADPEQEFSSFMITNNSGGNIYPNALLIEQKGPILDLHTAAYSASFASTYTLPQKYIENMPSGLGAVIFSAETRGKSVQCHFTFLTDKNLVLNLPDEPYSLQRKWSSQIVAAFPGPFPIFNYQSQPRHGIPKTDSAIKYERKIGGRGGIHGMKEYQFALNNIYAQINASSYATSHLIEFNPYFFEDYNHIKFRTSCLHSLSVDYSYQVAIRKEPRQTSSRKIEGDSVIFKLPRPFMRRAAEIAKFVPHEATSKLSQSFKLLNSYMETLEKRDDQ